mmetsp:Transcript_14610/g.23220  ORF Transcript_14610/g.23220 Transcript_14610/m.23220 type:complete len:104 (-) Transcript_14610:197-508(-)
MNCNKHSLSDYSLSRGAPELKLHHHQTRCSQFFFPPGVTVPKRFILRLLLLLLMVWFPYLQMLFLSLLGPLPLSQNYHLNTLQDHSLSGYCLVLLLQYHLLQS